MLVCPPRDVRPFAQRAGENQELFNSPFGMCSISSFGCWPKHCGNIWFHAQTALLLTLMDGMVGINLLFFFLFSWHTHLLNIEKQHDRAAFAEIRCMWSQRLTPTFICARLLPQILVAHNGVRHSSLPNSPISRILLPHAHRALSAARTQRKCIGTDSARRV